MMCGEMRGRAGFNLSLVVRLRAYKKEITTQQRLQGGVEWHASGRIRPNLYNVPSARFFTQTRNSLHINLLTMNFLYKSHAWMRAQVLRKLLRVPITLELKFFRFTCKIELFSLYILKLWVRFLAYLNVLDYSYIFSWKISGLTL